MTMPNTTTASAPCPTTGNPRRDSVLVFPDRGLLEQERALLAAIGCEYQAVLCHQSDREIVARHAEVIHTYDDGNLTSCRKDLPDLAQMLSPKKTPWVHVACVQESIAPHVTTMFRLLGYREIIRASAVDLETVALPIMPERINSLLLKASGGIGNVVLMSFLASASLDMGWETYFCPTFDVDDASLAHLFSGPMPKKLHLVAPEDLDNLHVDLSLNVEDHTLLTDEDFFHAPYRVGISGHAPTFAARFFENITGVLPDTGKTFVGGDPEGIPPELRDRIVVCPGSKVGWDSKRWPHMDTLIRRLDNPVVLCRQADLDAYGEFDFLTPITAPDATYITDFSLSEVGALFKTARAVIANDCGPAHMAAAAGAPTLMLFGPSSLTRNEHIRPNVRSASLGIDCQPCQGATEGPGRLGPWQFQCDLDYPCLAELSVDTILKELENMLGTSI